MNENWLNPLRDDSDLRLPRVAGSCVLVMFGVTGDLARKKLLPAIYDLAEHGALPPGFGLVGFARRDWSKEDFAKYVRDCVIEGSRTKFREEVWQQLEACLEFVSGAFDDEQAFANLKQTLNDYDASHGTGGNHAFYLSIPPKFFELVITQLNQHDMVDQSKGWKRAIIEKPFGRDLASAKELNEVVSAAFPAESVFRIDHYLGKETVQNLMAFRFANAMYEPIWDSRYISHVQITMAEDIGIGGRAGYYDGVGAARDVIQNHLFQLLALTAMEEPNTFNARDLRLEKEKVLEASSVPKDLAAHTANGQYAAGWQGGRPVSGFLEEDGIDPNSITETFAAIRVDIDNRRWAGVPFYLRTAKRMPRRTTEIALNFKRIPHLGFDKENIKDLGENALVMRIQPNEGIDMNFGAKVPGSTMDIRNVRMDFSYLGSFTESSPEAYERLILDVLLGDPPLFPQQNEVELSWKILDPVLDFWSDNGRPEQYEAGTWGPQCSYDMLARDGFEWRRP
ncbi:glucose-6-phosphate dehydrogenase [Propionimicrobium lymphophilum]|uniref:glucose-6-phosphate dehydrogenase n=1 Tax=Propionimicrobium lymphophilum TaxID=33012 RepID=UPI000490E8B7|nr:glucose-6-phosphate dehydrogenase [Propionimicrobium lymphophilum]